MSMQPEAPKSSYFYFLLAVTFLMTLELPGLRWSNYDYWWVDARNIGIGTILGNSISGLKTWSFDSDLGWNIASMNFFPLNPYLLLSPKYGVLISNVLSFFVGSFFLFKTLFKITGERFPSMALVLIYLSYPGFHGMPQNQLMFSSMMLAPVYAWFSLELFGQKVLSATACFILVGFIAISADLTVAVLAILAATPVLVWKILESYGKKAVFRKESFVRLAVCHLVWFLPWVIWYSQSETYGLALRDLHEFLVSQRAYLLLFYPEFGSSLFWDLPPFFLALVTIFFTDVRSRRYYKVLPLVFLAASLPYLLQELISSPTYLRWALALPAAACWAFVAFLVLNYRAENAGRDASDEIRLLIPLAIDSFLNWAVFEFFSRRPDAGLVIGAKVLLIGSFYLARVLRFRSRPRAALAVIAVSLVVYVYAPTFRNIYSKLPAMDTARHFKAHYDCVSRALGTENVGRLLITGTSLEKRSGQTRMIRSESGLYPEILMGKGYSVIGVYREKFDQFTGHFYSKLYGFAMTTHIMPPHESVVSDSVLNGMGVSHVLLNIDRGEDGVARSFEGRFRDRLRLLNVCVNEAPPRGAPTVTRLYRVEGGQPVGPLDGDSRVKVSRVSGTQLKWSVLNLSGKPKDLIWRYLPGRELLLRDGGAVFPVRLEDTFGFSVITVPAGYSGIISADYSGRSHLAYLYYYAALILVWALAIFCKPDFLKEPRL